MFMPRFADHVKQQLVITIKHAEEHIHGDVMKK
jgi:hypothetical protein